MPSAAHEAVTADAAAAEPRSRTSYAEILRSSAIIGGASGISIAIGMLRTKALAVLLGPAGFGLMGLYSSILELAQTIASLGTGASGVRQIAASAASGDHRAVAVTATVLKRVSWLLGAACALGLVVFAVPIASFSFGDPARQSDVRWLALAALFGLVAAGYGALVQGLRRLADLALNTVLGSLVGAIVTVVCVWTWGVHGLVLALVCSALTSILIIWGLARRVDLPAVQVDAAQFRAELAPMIRLGLAFMGSSLLTLGAAYLVRVMVVKQMGLGAAGLYQAAWTLSGLYVGFILQSMGADFYPRLVSSSEDHKRMTRLVNEQACVSLLLAGPGIIATIALAPVAIWLLYAPEFLQAIDTLRWMALGMALRIVSWPMGFIIVAKNRRATFFLVDLAWTVANVGLTWLCVSKMGLVGTGVAFFASYLFHTALVYPIVRRLVGFSWHRSNLALIAMFVGATGLAFASSLTLPLPAAIVAGVALTIASTLYSTRSLLRVVEPENTPRVLRKLQHLLRHRELDR